MRFIFRAVFLSIVLVLVAAILVVSCDPQPPQPSVAGVQPPGALPPVVEAPSSKKGGMGERFGAVADNLLNEMGKVAVRAGEVLQDATQRGRGSQPSSDVQQKDLQEGPRPNLTDIESQLKGTPVAQPTASRSLMQRF